MNLVELAVFDVVHAHLPWPWVAIDPTRTRLAFATAPHAVATRALLGTNGTTTVTAGVSFALPADLGLPAEPAPQPAPHDAHRGAAAGVHGFALDPSGALLAVVGTVAAQSVLVTLDGQGEHLCSRMDALVTASAGDEFVAHAVAFDRSGTRLWISADSAGESALLLVDARSHEVFGVVRGAAFPPPAAHELHVHPADDAVLLLASCGEEGTFARVAGWSGGDPRSVTAVPTALDGGSPSAGFVGFSADLAHVHLVEAEELRTHAWPGLVELASVPLAGDFVSSYSGVVLGPRVYIDGALDDGEGDEARGEGVNDAVMLFDRSALRGSIVKPPVPRGMWIGRLGVDALVTVESKGDPALARILRLPAPEN